MACYFFFKNYFINCYLKNYFIINNYLNSIIKLTQLFITNSYDITLNIWRVKKFSFTGSNLKKKKKESSFKQIIWQLIYDSSLLAMTFILSVPFYSFSSFNSTLLNPEDREQTTINSYLLEIVIGTFIKRTSSPSFLMENLAEGPTD